MTKIKLPRHLEGSRTHCPLPEYRHRGEFSDPSNTWPDAAARNDDKESYLYQGGKWRPEDDGFFNDYEIFNGNE